MKRRTAIAALICASAAAGLPSAARADLSPKQIASLLLRVLAYDRNLKKRSDGKAASVLVLFTEGNQASEGLQLDLINALEDLSGSVSVAGLPIKATALAYTSDKALEAQLIALRPVAIFVTSGLGEAVAGVSTLSRRRSALTMTLNTAYIKAGLAVGITESEEHIKIIINLPASRAEGADFDVALLRIAEVYR